ncbi:NAD(P)-dependent oxidoreductase (plasmid) [Azospirillum oryzae]|uniref:NAD(P)-dependent oxidoreductase n=1 Tax=Azospirillum oryzae TaxID=286727 RepID=A0A6N1ARE0_9PROT|nr:NAD(P)-binding domain-containing protein [Azospirillum oryzae]KAA0586976.1 NAD(P)-dependent oxidoreductase [Azospirillum oryzae]QKS54160.1 NAD(P)-dependent oxidoreductase [Azospirillum oryzae]
MDVGFIGDGMMAEAIMDRLREAGHRLHRHPHGRGDFRHRAGRCDVVMMLLPDAPAVESALFAEDGFAAALSPGALVIDLSVLPPAEASANASRLADLGVPLVDAPAGAGPVIDLGGSDAACARAEPLLRLFTDGVVRAGGPGSGQRVRLIRMSDGKPSGMKMTDRNIDDPDGLHRLLRLMAFDGPAESRLGTS